MPARVDDSGVLFLPHAKREHSESCRVIVHFVMINGLVVMICGLVGIASHLVLSIVGQDWLHWSKPFGRRLPIVGRDSLLWSTLVGHGPDWGFQSSSWFGSVVLEFKFGRFLTPWNCGSPGGAK